MARSALRSLTDAIDATRGFLFDPLDTRRWLALAFVVFFAGGLGGFNPASFANAGQPQTTQPIGDLPADPVAELTSFVQAYFVEILVVAALVVAVLLALRFVAAVMEFVFVESLRTESVRIGSYWSEYSGKGLRLFGFRLVLGLVSFATFAGLGAGAYSYFLGARRLTFGLLVLAAVVGSLVLLATTLIGWFTTAFVVPVMIVEDRGVLASWSRLLPVLRRNWVEYLLYVVLAWVLRIALASVAGILVGLVAFVVAIPFVLLGLIAVVLTGGLALVVVVPLAVLGFVLLMALGAVVQVPFASYLRYYELLLLGDTDAGLDTIPEIRARVREDADASASD